MALEIERKYRIDPKGWALMQATLPFKVIKQAYLSVDAHKTVRIRIKGNQAYLTIKSAMKGLVRKEFEYEVPLEDGLEMLELCGDARIEKKRYFFESNALTWEIDVFEGLNAGLVIAEVELNLRTADYQSAALDFRGGI